MRISVHIRSETLDSRMVWILTPLVKTSFKYLTLNDEEKLQESKHLEEGGWHIYVMKARGVVEE